jgi:pimeloyl-ACP methyl ester carboxylesterase
MRTLSLVFNAILFSFSSLNAAETHSTPPEAGSQIASGSEIAARDAKIDNVQLHYLTAGKGPAVILLHGFAETSRMWRPLIPLLAEKFTVIAPDLPGIGDSSIPDNSENLRERGIDMLSAAKEIHDLVRSLGVEKARVVGHDIGLMVAYAYAAQFPDETEKLVLMDAFLRLGRPSRIVNGFRPNRAPVTTSLSGTGSFRKTADDRC